jgi:regulator of RNase E activity RraA
MGAILATRIHRRGAAGVVTDGAFRDSPAIAALGLPAYAGAMNAHTNKTIHHPSELQVPIACGEVAVFPGDVIVGDGEGVVVVPAQLADEVAVRAVEMEDKEDFLLERVRGGASIVGTYPPDAATLAAYERWRRDRRAPADTEDPS